MCSLLALQRSHLINVKIGRWSSLVNGKIPDMMEQ